MPNETRTGQMVRAGDATPAVVHTEAEVADALERLPKTEREPCPDCDATGRLDGDVRCPRCEGLGFAYPVTCETCWTPEGGSTGWVARDAPTAHPDFGKSMRCPSCGGPQSSLAYVLEASGVPPDMQRFTFDTFNPQSREQRRALKVVKALAEDPAGHAERNDGRTGLYLVGDTGVGKTGLAVALMAHMAANRRPCPTMRLVRWDAWMEEIKAGFDSDVPQDVLVERLARPLVLVVDEVDPESLWQARRARKLAEARHAAAHERNAVTIWTTQVPLHEMESRHDHVSEAVGSRIRGACTAFEVRGPDLRRA